MFQMRGRVSAPAFRDDPRSHREFVSSSAVAACEAAGKHAHAQRAGKDGVPSQGKAVDAEAVPSSHARHAVAFSPHVTANPAEVGLDSRTTACMILYEQLAVTVTAANREIAADVLFKRKRFDIAKKQR